MKISDILLVFLVPGLIFYLKNKVNRLIINKKSISYLIFDIG